MVLNILKGTAGVNGAIFGEIRGNPMHQFLALPAGLELKSPLQVLPDETSHSVLLLSAWAGEKPQRVVGPAHHHLLAEWLQTGLSSPQDLWAWLLERSKRESGQESPEAEIRHPGHAKTFDRARRQADCWRESGILAATWQNDALPPPLRMGLSCPRVIYFQGDPNPGQHWAALFNSRKPRQLQPDDHWLRVLRAWLPRIAESPAGFASSCGTLSYDLVTAFAQEQGSRLLLLVPFPLDALQDLSQPESQRTFFRSHPVSLLLSCSVGTLGCDKSTRMTCRDRLLAHLADFHLVLEVRNRGNLRSVLHRQQTHQPRRQWVLLPSPPTSETLGNLQLLEHFPQWSQNIPEHEWAPISSRSAARPARRCRRTRPDPPEPRNIPWRNYLYHYTRSCPGPWPGQSYREYLLSLLRNEPGSGHSGADSLIRILSEKMLRASGKLVRGTQPVISWSARPPFELAELRKWNRALIRWTFEAYGIAVCRHSLRHLGIQPVIYGPARIHECLLPADRFRFQLHMPPHCCWKQEREWRLPTDLHLRADLDAFLFVPDERAAELIDAQVACPFPIISLDRLPAPQRV